jgi:hypothetical protein
MLKSGRMMKMTSNRVAVAAQLYREKMSEEGKKTLISQFKEISLDELHLFQESKSIAQAMGIISLEEATTIYRVLCDWSGSSICDKLAVYTVCVEIVKKVRRVPSQVTTS